MLTMIAVVHPSGTLLSKPCFSKDDVYEVYHTARKRRDHLGYAHRGQSGTWFVSIVHRNKAHAISSIKGRTRDRESKTKKNTISGMLLVVVLVTTAYEPTDRGWA